MYGERDQIDAAAAVLVSVLLHAPAIADVEHESWKDYLLWFKRTYIPACKVMALSSVLRVVQGVHQDQVDAGQLFDRNALLRGDRVAALTLAREVRVWCRQGTPLEEGA
jgi:hypothetical protein